MFLKKNRKNFVFQPLIILAILLFQQPASSQYLPAEDTTLKITKGSYLQFKEIRAFVPKDTIIKLSPSLVPSDNSLKNNTIVFYDSMKVRASRKRFTKTLYDFVVVSPDTAIKRKVDHNSEETYTDFSGKKIRKIQIQRLNVFGTDVNNPAYYNPNGSEKLMNGTHVNTNENIIRKFLLFSEGDTISPLTLSDNERIIRQLPHIDDARIIVVPVSDEEADVIVVTKDVYSVGGEFMYKGKTSGNVRLFDKNFFGMGHEFIIDIPYSKKSTDSPGVGLTYYVNNVRRTFTDLSISYYNGLGRRIYGVSLIKNLLSSVTKYAGGITLNSTYTSEDLDTLPVAKPLKYNYQDYWIQRSFLLDKEPVIRIMTGIRYINNNVFERPMINPDSYHSLQRYQLFLGSAAFSVQKYYKTNLLYSYGRTEDVPNGLLLRLTSGWEINEFKDRLYAGTDLSFGQTVQKLGYLYVSSSYGTYFKDNHPDQGVLVLKFKYFSNLIFLGDAKIRNFINVDFTRGLNRNIDEFLSISKANGFTGFSNDSLRGLQRLVIGLESVVFSPSDVYGFKFAFFGFANYGLIGGSKAILSRGMILSSLGFGIRIRNDNLIFNTFQIKIGYFPDPPAYSNINYLTFSGEQLLRPNNFDPGPPAVVTYR
jgi:hypothetical protein